MKKKRILVVLALFATILISSYSTKAIGCGDVCVPSEDDTCGFVLYDGEILICGNYAPMKLLPPGKPTL